ncbi:UDP-Glycosyltransferase/glycogen phosphorylase, partial [Fistulina hepatica ATCC 64428]
TENFLPKIDGVTRTLMKLLIHLRRGGHHVLVLGPASGMSEYEGAQICGTRGLPLVVYPDLKLNWFNPAFVHRLQEFQPEVIHVVDPIWLCAQSIPMVRYILPEVELVSSYHTNLASYSSLFGFSWLSPAIWAIQRYLHGQAKITFCPSSSTAAMLRSHGFCQPDKPSTSRSGFPSLRVWGRGVDTALFNPSRRDASLRVEWMPELAAGHTKALLAFGGGNAVVLLYVGRLSWEKNLRLLVEAFRGLNELVASRHELSDSAVSAPAPRCKLVFVGSGPARTEIETLCASYALDVAFTGQLRGEALARVFASADVFAFPSWTETFGQVVLEALASGLAVVGLDAEGVCDLVSHGETGLLMPWNLVCGDGDAVSVSPHAFFDPKGPHFAGAVARYRALLAEVVLSPEMRWQMAGRAVEAASKHTWSGAMDVVVKGYREVAAVTRLHRSRKASEPRGALGWLHHAWRKCISVSLVDFPFYHFIGN